MEKGNKWLTPLIVGSFVAVLALGLVAYTSAKAAVSGPLALIQEVESETDDDTQEPTPFFGRGGFRPFGHHGWFGGAIDYDSYLADALGISVDELQSARQSANDAAIDEAVAQGFITEEQAELMRARSALMAYIDKDELLADALGISSNELQTAREEGKTIRALIDELGLEAADVHDAMQAGFDEAVQAAVDDGVITQELADEIQSRAGCWFDFGGHPRGGGKRGGMRGFDGLPFPNTDVESDSDL